MSWTLKEKKGLDRPQKKWKYIRKSRDRTLVPRAHGLQKRTLGPKPSFD